MTAALLPNRPALVQHSRRLNYATLMYNSLEGVLSIGAGLLAGSIALVGFGTDSLIELTAGAAALWRLSADLNQGRRERVEQQTLRLIGLCFLALAGYVSLEAIQGLVDRTRPSRARWALGLQPPPCSSCRFWRGPSAPSLSSLGVVPWPRKPSKR